jgi:hypothetical protein
MQALQGSDHPVRYLQRPIQHKPACNPYLQRDLYLEAIVNDHRLQTLCQWCQSWQ